MFDGGELWELWKLLVLKGIFKLTTALAVVVVVVVVLWGWFVAIIFLVVVFFLGGNVVEIFVGILAKQGIAGCLELVCGGHRNQNSP